MVHARNLTHHWGTIITVTADGQEKFRTRTPLTADAEASKGFGGNDTRRHRYFPNKYAVILSLTERLAVEWDRSMAKLYRRLTYPNEDWSRALRDARGDWPADSRPLVTRVAHPSG
jgi:hypothetical protein